jgi:hypothetical protein
MSNVHGLFINKSNDEDDNDDDESNNRYVGGIGARGGGRCVLLRAKDSSLQLVLENSLSFLESPLTLVLCHIRFFI